MAWIGVITNAGAALLANYAQGEHTLHITGASVGSGTVAEANLRVQTAVSSEQDEASIVEKTAVTGGMKFKIQVGPASTAAYTAHQIGLWAKLDSGSVTLLALAQDAANGVGVPLASVTPAFAFALFLTVAVSNTGSISVTIDEGAFVTQGTMATALAGKVDIADIANNLTTTAEGKVLDARQGKALSDALALKVAKADIDDTAGTGDTGKLWSADKLVSALAGKVDTADIANNLTTTAEGKVLDARQGKALNDAVALKVAKADIDDTAGAGATGKLWSADKLVSALAGKANVSASLSLTAAAASWSGAEPSTQTISAAGVTAAGNILVGAGSMTSAQREAMIAAQIACTAQGDGTITLTCYGEVPEIDLPIVVFILG